MPTAEGDLDDIGRDLAWVGGVVGQGLRIGNEQVLFRRCLQLKAGLERAGVMAQVQRTGESISGQDGARPCFYPSGLAPDGRSGEVLAMSPVCFIAIAFMRWIALTAVVVVACIAALLLSQQKVLWHVTEPGMTPQEVRAALPDAVPPPQPKSLDNGLSLGLVVPKVSNLDRAFNAELYFDERGLQQVLLLPTRLLAPSAAMIEFDELRRAASLRYGRERAGSGTRSVDVPAEAHWRAGSVTVTLRVEQRGQYAAVMMSYAAGS